MRKIYRDTSYGQIHARELAADGDESRPPLVCLHPAPYSGLHFTTAMPLLNIGRRVLAPDYPGYGGSDPIEDATIEIYAAAIGELIESTAGPVDILGFHTGCLVGVELALNTPDSIRRLLLCDVPYFDTEARQNLAAKMSVPLPLTADIESISGAWNFDIVSRVGAVPLGRAFELFAEHLRAGTREHFAFKAAFSYDSEGRFPRLIGDVVVLATQSSLHEPSTQAAKAIPGAQFVDVPEITSAVFEAGAKSISKRINDLLSFT